MINSILEALFLYRISLLVYYDTVISQDEFISARAGQLARNIWTGLAHRMLTTGET